MSTQFVVPKAATWLWFLERDYGGVALDASRSPGPIASELSRHFEEVRVLREDRAALDEVGRYAEKVGDRAHTLTLGSLSTTAFEGQSFDCIALHDRIAMDVPSVAERIETLGRLRGLLEPGGWLVAGASIPPLFRRRAAAKAGISPRGFSRMLRKAGFREVRRIFVAPSIDSPITMVPDAPDAVASFEAFDTIRGSTSRIRQLVARLGLRDRLHPAYFIMARA